jgi:hypothetical protein
MGRSKKVRLNLNIMKTVPGLFIIIFLFSVQIIHSQIIKSKLDIVGGISAREYAHAGLRYQYSDFTQVGIYIGNDLELKSNEHISTVCFDHLIHFGKLNYYSNRPVWYNRLGFTILKNEIGDYDLNKYSYFNMGMGREMAFSDRLGVNIDAGMILQFRRKMIKPSSETPLNTRWYTFPLARIQVFYSF